MINAQCVRYFTYGKPVHRPDLLKLDDHLIVSYLWRRISGHDSNSTYSSAISGD